MENLPEGYLKSYIILPSAIYGIAKNTLVEKGISNPYGVQIPVLIAASLDRGRAGRVGAGKNVWPNVHIDDRASLSRCPDIKDTTDAR
jgi:hypothetical protein